MTWTVTLIVILIGLSLAIDVQAQSATAKSWTVAAAEALYDPNLHLLVDDDAVAETLGVAKVIGRPHVPSEPLFYLDKPWEIGRMFFGYGTSVLQDPQTGKLRMYYSVDDSHGRDSAQHMPGTSFMCIAESVDGLHWSKPNLGLYEFAGSKQNNILYAYTHGKGPVGRVVGAVLDDPTETDPVRRFKMFGDMVDVDGKRGYCIMTSPDGLRWDMKPKFVTGEGLDTFLMTWDAAQKQWLRIGRLWLPGDLADKAAEAWKRYLGTGPQGARAVGVWEGTDLYNMPGKGYAMRVDEADGYGARYQHWGMQPFNYGSQYLGVLLVNSELGPNPRLYLTSSKDGRNWQHVMRWQEFIPLGGEGRWNGEVNCLTINPPVKIGEDVFFYYTGRTSSRAGNAINHPGVAVFKQDRFTGYIANKGGHVLTRPVEVAGPQLYVNFLCIWGEMRVELRDTDGKPIPGYTAGDCVPLQPDETDKAAQFKVTWKDKDGLTELMGRQVQIRFNFRVATLYAYRFGE